MFRRLTVVPRWQLVAGLVGHGAEMAVRGITGAIVDSFTERLGVRGWFLAELGCRGGLISGRRCAESGPPGAFLQGAVGLPGAEDGGRGNVDQRADQHRE